MLPTTPQSLSDLQARYAAAVVKVFDALAVYEGRVSRPGEDPAHVFDTQSGIRLIVSRERLPDGKVYLHVSASFAPGSDIVARIEARQLSVEQALAEVEATWQAIAQSEKKLRFVRLSPGKGVPHFMLEEAEELCT